MATLECNTFFLLFSMSMPRKCQKMSKSGFLIYVLTRVFPSKPKNVSFGQVFQQILKSFRILPLHLTQTVGSDVHNPLNEVSKAKDFIKALKESSINQFLVIFDPPPPSISNHQHFNTPPFLIISAFPILTPFFLRGCSIWTRQTSGALMKRNTDRFFQNSNHFSREFITLLHFLLKSVLVILTNKRLIKLFIKNRYTATQNLYTKGGLDVLNECKLK